MAIKLADVIENINSDYAVVATEKQNILGIYNGAIGTVPPIQLYYASNAKIALTSDGTATNRIQVYKDPLSLQAASNLVDVSMDLKFHTRKGAIFSVHDEKLHAGAGGPALYLTKQDPTAGTGSDSARSAISRFTELVQQFDVYESITGTAAAEANDADGESFFLAGFDTANGKMRKITWAEIAGGIAAQVSLDLINSGAITETQAGGSGAIGDLNGDGQVTTSDMLILLASIGQTGLGYETYYTTFDGADESSEFIPGVSPFASAGTFALSDLSTFQYDSNLTTDGEAYGWASVSVAVLQNNFVRLNTMSYGPGDTLLSTHWPSRRLVVEMDLSLNFDAPDSVFPLLYVKLTFENNSTQECMYIMGTSNQEVNSLGLYSAGYGGQQGGIPIAVDIPITVQADLGTMNSLNYPAADNYENHSSALAQGFMMDHTNGASNYIKHLETRIYFGSVTASTNVIVKEIRTRIYQQ